MTENPASQARHILNRASRVLVLRITEGTANGQVSIHPCHSHYLVPARQKARVISRTSQSRVGTSCTLPPVRSIRALSLGRSGLWSSQVCTSRKRNNNAFLGPADSLAVCLPRISRYQGSVVRPRSVPGPGKIEPSARPRSTRLSPMLPTRR